MAGDLCVQCCAQRAGRQQRKLAAAPPLLRSRAGGTPSAQGPADERCTCRSDYGAETPQLAARPAWRL